MNLNTADLVVVVVLVSLSLLAVFSDAYSNCKEGGPNQCTEFLKPNICGRLIWCYKREKVDNITNLCMFSDTKLSSFYFNAEAPPVPDPEKCTPVTDEENTCYKICNQLTNTVYPFLGVFNVCLMHNSAYMCTSSKGNKRQYCGCGQLANADIIVKKPGAIPGEPCNI